MRHFLYLRFPFLPSQPAQDVILAQQITIAKVEKNLQQQLLELASVRTGLAKINLD